MTLLLCGMFWAVLQYWLEWEINVTSSFDIISVVLCPLLTNVWKVYAATSVTLFKAMNFWSSVCGVLEFSARFSTSQALSSRLETVEVAIWPSCSSDLLQSSCIRVKLLEVVQRKISSVASAVKSSLLHIINCEAWDEVCSFIHMKTVY